MYLHLLKEKKKLIPQFIGARLNKQKSPTGSPLLYSTSDRSNQTCQKLWLLGNKLMIEINIWWRISTVFNASANKISNQESKKAAQRLDYESGCTPTRPGSQSKVIVAKMENRQYFHKKVKFYSHWQITGNVSALARAFLKQRFCAKWAL